MHHLNRAAVILIPKQPFVDWLHSTPDPPDFITLDYLLEQGDHHVYLIPEVEDLSTAPEVIERLAPAILEQELGAWYTNTAAWPERLDYGTLVEFFEVMLSSEVTDTVSGAIRREKAVW